MLFNSYVFLLVFLPIVLAGWWALAGRQRSRIAWLVVASCCFYGWFDLPTGFRLLPLLFISTTADYVGARIIHRLDDPVRRRIALVATLSVNLGLLAGFKYLGLLQQAVNAIAEVLGGSGQLVPVYELLVPIGISFYTFNSMSYTLDVYRRQVEPVHDYLHYAAFVTLFPHLLAGPIVRYAEIGRQLLAPPRRLTSRMLLVGSIFILVGLWKKVVVADGIAPWVDRLHDNHEALQLVTGWAAAVGFTLQLYFDFSAYSDMATGVALLLGLRFPMNFDSPLRAASTGDFWRRWNMSLTRWIRDYLYVPLGGSRRGTGRVMFNVVLCCTIMGIWHGPTWNYLLAGFGFGVVAVAERTWRTRAPVQVPRPIAQALTLIVIAVLFAVFRSESVAAVGDVWSAMAGMNGVGMDALGAAGPSPSYLTGWQATQLVLLVVAIYAVPNSWQIALDGPRWRIPVVALGGAAGVLLLAQPSEFLYFAF